MRDKIKEHVRFEGNSMNIVLLGSPGIGKGTYADILSKKYGIPHISSGQLFREEMEKKNDLGKKVDDYINRGELVPDEITIEFIKERLKKKDCNNGFFLDGYPRTIPQAEELENFSKIDNVLNFVASEDVIVDRLGGRRTCKECGAIFHIKNVPPKVKGVCDQCSGELYQREDEKPEAIKIRMREYNKKTKPLVDFYKKKGLLVNIDANPPIEEVDRIISQCDKALSTIKRK